MSARLEVVLNDGSTETHHLSRPDSGGTIGDYRYEVSGAVLFVYKGYEGVTAYPLTSVIRWDVRE